MNYFTVLSTSGLQDQLSSLRTSAEVMGKKVNWHNPQKTKSKVKWSPVTLQWEKHFMYLHNLHLSVPSDRQSLNHYNASALKPVCFNLSDL